MNSPNSQAIDEIESKLRGHILFESVNQVMNTIAGLSIDELAVKNIDHILRNSACLTGVLFMTGPHNMAVMIGLPMDEAYNLTTKITGIEFSDLIEEHLFDVINELANLISGRIKALLAQKGFVYANSYPFIVCGKEYVLAHSPKLRQIIKRFSTENLELVLKVVFI